MTSTEIHVSTFHWKKVHDLNLNFENTPNTVPDIVVCHTLLLPRNFSGLRKNWMFQLHIEVYIVTPFSNWMFGCALGLCITVGRCGCLSYMFMFSSLVLLLLLFCLWLRGFPWLFETPTIPLCNVHAHTSVLSNIAAFVFG